MMATETSELSKSALELLIEAARTLFEESDYQNLLGRLLDKAVEVGQAERGYIIVRSPEGEMKLAMSRGMEIGSIAEGDPSNSVIQRALQERRPIISRNASRDPRFGGAESLIIRGIRSTCCIPMVSNNSVVGALYLDAAGVGRLTENELPLLEAFGGLAGSALARALELDDAKRVIKDVGGGQRFQGIVGTSTAMNRLFDRMDRIAVADLPVLISGESGTGKELIARALHNNSNRAKMPMRAIYCGNLSAELLESELFGYKKGAFTGAVADKPGLLDLSEKGTLFLDEIADVPMSIQAKLLRFLQDGEYQRLGDPHIRHADVRIFSATNKNLSTEIAEGRFREDLYYRLNVLTIEAPPLRTRKGDIPLLAAAILSRIATRTGQPTRRISVASLRKLERNDWPGNVREMENILARAAVLAAGDTIEPEEIDIGEFVDDTPHADHDDLSMEAAVRAHALKVLSQTGGNRSEAARLMGVSRRYLQKSLAKWREDEDSDTDDDES